MLWAVGCILFGSVGLILFRKNIYTKGQLIVDLREKVALKIIAKKFFKAVLIAPFALSIMLGLLLFAGSMM